MEEVTYSFPLNYMGIILLPVTIFQLRELGTLRTIGFTNTFYASVIIKYFTEWLWRHCEWISCVVLSVTLPEAFFLF